MNYNPHDKGLASRKLNPSDKPYEQRIEEALETIRKNPDFKIVDDEADMGLIFISYHASGAKTDVQLCVLSDQFSAMENWLMIKPIAQLAHYTMEV